MRTPPPDLSAAQLGAAVATHWSITALTVDYRPLGFGSHHWTLTEPGGRRWFVTADPHGDTTPQLDQLTAALNTAYALRHWCGLPFVVAPQPSKDHRLLSVTGPYAITLYPYVTSATATSASAPQMLDMIVAVHAATAQVGHLPHVDDLSIANRDVIERLVDGEGTNRGDGPYRARFTRLIGSHRELLRTAFDRYDTIASPVAAERDTWVVTHGEPKPNNSMVTPAGPVLVDWDTAQLAPAARDLWMLPARDEYTRITGRRIPAEHLQMYRLRWDLKDLSHFGSWLLTATSITADTERAWHGSVRICHRLAEHT